MPGARGRGTVEWMHHMGRVKNTWWIRGSGTIRCGEAKRRETVSLPQRINDFDTM